MRYNAPREFRYTDEEKKAMCLYNEDYLDKLKKKYYVLRGRDGALMDAIKEFKPQYDRSYYDILYPVKSELDKFL
jgi:hypothetical protein